MNKYTMLMNYTRSYSKDLVSYLAAAVFGIHRSVILFNVIVLWKHASFFWGGGGQVRSFEKIIIYNHLLFKKKEEGGL